MQAGERREGPADASRWQGRGATVPGGLWGCANEAVARWGLDRLRIAEASAGRVWSIMPAIMPCTPVHVKGSSVPSCMASEL